MRIGYFNIIKIDHEYAIQLYVIKVCDFDSKTKSVMNAILNRPWSFIGYLWRQIYLRI